MAALSALTACPNPQEQFDLFVERYNAIHGGEGGAGGEPVGGAPACPLPVPPEGDGVYLFALSATLDPPKAFALDGTFSAVPDGDGLIAELSLQPLSAADQSTPVGDPILLTGLPIEPDGSFDWDVGEITLIGEANPVTGSDVVATVQFHGEHCGGDAVEFICGTVTGAVSSPIDFDLAGSTFTMQRYEGTKPAPVINCAKDPAVY